MTFKLEAGDVFVIPIDAERSGIGQIAGNWKGELYIVLYDWVGATAEASPEMVERLKPVFAALSLDAKIHCGDWKVIGTSTENLKRIPQPVFKVGLGGRTILESRDRLVSRPASDAEEAVLRPRTVVAPVRLETALKAYFGIGDWHPRFDELRSDYANISSRLVSMERG